MNSTIKSRLNAFGLPRIIIIGFLFLLMVMAVIQKQDMGMLTSDILVRFGMNLVMSLAMVPAVMSGTGMNFGLPVGLLCGILGGLIAIEMGFVGWTGLFISILIALPISFIAGWLYGKLINAVKGSEMVVGTYIGYSVVSLMCMGWLMMPFKSPAMVWPLKGKGLRNTIVLSGIYEKQLNDFLSFKIFGVTIPTGLILFGLLCCGIMYLFTKSKTGVMLKAAGDNPRFAAASGISVDRSRMIGTILSTVIGAISIVVYAQAFGFFQLYVAPLNMAFAPVAAVLLGGASNKSIRISHVILGTFLFHSLLTVAMPVANILLPEGDLAEVVRLVVSNGIILYALTQAGGASK